MPAPADPDEPTLSPPERLEVAGASLHLRRWRPRDGSRRPAVALVHGFGEHVGRHESLAVALASSGREVLAFDQRGHGRSPGPRALVDRLGRALDDLDALVALARDAGGGSGEPVLLGHSMGGAFAAAYAATRPGALGALVLSAPALHLASLPRSRTAPARLLARVAPRAPAGRVDPAALSRDEREVTAFLEDPLAWHGRVPVATAWAMHEAGRLASEGAGSLRLPILVVHGEADAVVPVGSSRRFVAASGSPDATLVVVPGGAHEPLHDLGRDDVLRRVVEWVDRH